MREKQKNIYLYRKKEGMQKRGLSLDNVFNREYGYGHAFFDDYYVFKWPYEHPYGIHNWDPTLDHRPDHPVTHYLSKQHWLGYSDRFEHYLIDGRIIYIPRHISHQNKWKKNEGLLNEIKDQKAFQRAQRMFRNDLRDRRFPYNFKWPPHFHKYN